MHGMRALALLALAGCGTCLTEEYVRSHAPLLWASFKRDHGKRYATAEEDARRYAVFHDNMVRAAGLNAAEGAGGARFGMGPFVDLTAEEFKVYHNLTVPVRAGGEDGASVLTAEERAAAANVTAVDWRTKNAVTHVKNQKQCGSCWSFSTTGGIEGQNALHGTKELTPLSEQELVSCDLGFGDLGCLGGLMQNAHKYLLAKKGGAIVTEAAYPYTSNFFWPGLCKDTSKMEVGATIKGSQMLQQDEGELEAFVAAKGPLSVAVDATKWQTYTGGVLEQCTDGAPKLDHGVLVVGFGADFWIVKNSWGPAWGEAGFIRVRKGSNQCGITQNAVTATF